MNVFSEYIILTSFWICMLLIFNDKIIVASEKLNNSQLIKAESEDREYSIEDNDQNNNRHSSERRKRRAFENEVHLWEDGIIPYKIDYTFEKNEVVLFKEAMRHWENSTCIQFVEREKKHSDYVEFTRLSCGCCSNDRKQGKGIQYISIDKDCADFGTVLHELGRVIGILHEQLHLDHEDEYTEKKSNSFDQSYNYSLISHNDGRAFLKDLTFHTISSKRHSEEFLNIDRKIELSDTDIIQTSLFYNCPVCGKALFESNGIFHSPNETRLSISGTYYCEWRIHVSSGKKIIIHITSIDLYKDDFCETDYLEILNGYSHQSPVLRRFCGRSKIPFTVSSENNRILVRYLKTSLGNEYSGFRASYETICGSDINLTYLNKQINLKSPNYGENSLPNTECTWGVFVPERYRVVLKFESFKIEYNSNCTQNYLEVRDGTNLNSTLIGRYCGTVDLQQTITSSEHTLFMRFVSDGIGEMNEFNVTISAEIMV